jgi:hypothetical protein
MLLINNLFLGISSFIKISNNLILIFDCFEISNPVKTSNKLISLLLISSLLNKKFKESNFSLSLIFFFSFILLLF